MAHLLINFLAVSLNGESNQNLFMRPQFQARSQGFMPIILVTQKAEIRRIVVQNQTRQIVHEALSQKKSFTKKDWWSDSRCRL
jgi:hypothetical protein